MTDFKILFVEDDHDLRELVHSALKDYGFFCKAAKDGLEAVELLKKESFDLLITDLRMPRMDGAQLLEWCRQASLHFPVIFLSANTELLSKEKIVVSDCCASIVPKPASFDVLINAINDAKTRIHKRDCPQ